MEGLAARKTALTILDEVLLEKQPLDVTLETTVAQVLASLEPRDRAFARALATVTLRHLGEIDHALSAFLTKPLPKKARSAHNILRLAIAQFKYFKVPDHAAVDSAVSLAKLSQPTRPFAKLVNGVLRNALRANVKEAEEFPLHNVPEWLRESWLKTFGAATTEAIARAHLIEPALDITIKADSSTWVEKLEATALPTGSLRVANAGDIRNLNGFEEGAWWIQDAAASLPATLFGDVSDRRVLDLCAAPGGKTAQLAAAGARVTAVDRSEKRLERVAENLARLDLKAELITADATNYQPSEPFDLVLLDAPCSATGTIRRHPDLPWLKSSRDVVKLADLQSRLLKAAASMVAPGGTLIYCTCSLQPEEGPAQIASFLDANAGFTRRPIQSSEVANQEAFLTPDGDLQTLPCHWPESGGIDGFFASRILSKS